MAAMTAAISFAVAALQCVYTCSCLKTAETSSVDVVAAYLEEVFTLLTLGLFIFAFFHVIALLFEGIGITSRQESAKNSI
jgi:hypothetical protein